MILILSLQLVGYIFFPNKARAADNTIYIDSVGNNNEVVVNQYGSGHMASVAIGTYLPTNNTDLTSGYGIGTQNYGGTTDYNYVGIRQQGVGNKTATVEIPTGTYNFVTVFQDGTGNHSAAIQNLQGNNNYIGIVQNDSGNHTMNITNNVGTTNSNNTINTTQTGAGDKSFALTMAGSNGATVTVQQTNPTQANTGAMTIQCNPCGAYSYTRQ